MLAGMAAAGPAAEQLSEQLLVEAPAFVELFAPAGHAAAYRAYVSSQSPSRLLSILRQEPAPAPFDAGIFVSTPGAWELRRERPLDAFGRSGSYNRSRLARLYGSRAVSVARGARAAGGRVTESWTLLSPYPDPSLERLESGTLVLILTVP
jgi:hypothetical protein